MGRGSRRRRKRQKQKQKLKRREPLRIEITREVLEVDAGATCPLCRDAVVPADPTLPAMRCDGCQTIYHQPCFDELGGCSVLGCGRIRIERRALQRQAADEQRHEERRRRHQVQDPNSDDETDSGLSLTGVGLVVIGVIALGGMVLGYNTVFSGALCLFMVIAAFALRRGKTAP